MSEHDSGNGPRTDAQPGEQPAWPFEPPAPAGDADGLQPPEPGEPITTGDLLRRTFRAFGRHFGAFFVLTLLVLLPSILIELLLDLRLMREGVPMRQGYPVHPAWWTAGTTFNDTFLVTLLTYVAQAIIITATVNQMRGRPIRMGEAIATALRRFLSVIGAAILLSIVIGVGFVCLVIPGIIFACLFFVTLPAIVMEQVGPIEGMRRSVELTRGYRFKIFGAAVVLWLPAIALLVCLGAFGPDVIAMGGAGTEMGPNFVMLAIGWAVTIIMTMLLAILAAVFYARARDVHEGMDLEQLAAVFR
ncbi:MAG: hypothetical protein WD009_02220 [Phycisphaeraceae bacterium]